MEKIRLNKQLIKFIHDFHEKRKGLIACICSGVQLLISAKVVKGKKLLVIMHWKTILPMQELYIQIYQQ